MILFFFFNRSLLEARREIILSEGKVVAFVLIGCYFSMCVFGLFYSLDCPSGK